MDANINSLALCCSVLCIESPATYIYLLTVQIDNSLIVATNRSIIEYIVPVNDRQGWFIGHAWWGGQKWDSYILSEQPVYSKTAQDF